MTLLLAFLLRLAFGLALGMTLVSHRKTPSGYFRNHLYVVLGLAALATLAGRATGSQAFVWALAAAALSYLGAACWLYERAGWGYAALFATALAALGGALQVSAGPALTDPAPWAALLRGAQGAGSGLLLGFTLAAMLLGHWHLNAPGMPLGPLRRLLAAVMIAVGIQAAICALGTVLQVSHGEFAATTRWWLFLTLRWSFGLVGVAVLVGMARQTLRIPNTQSATGILYVALIGTFVGEVMSLLLSAESIYPL
jgi:hypothetical protein